ncbi:MBL fold metallo-hydrolase [Luteibacter sahnii]|uniref:MBL fold metallo-hydrolase n=1 Tax=Luteibacter sahnii TaxID=3021977 RepID=UPI002A6AA7B5|nr:MBL fold metallo-hydrolase [Luteibacter sp. PPL193]MDY1550017.1 MBL fold metallo-hydrolase [Luteibacter sp. PPL193]
MSEKLMYLRPEVKIEPLVGRWHAWPHLVSPVQLALHVAYRLLPLLKSFVGSPAAHVTANQDPKMYGGPFVGLRDEDVDAAKALIAKLEVDAAPLIALAADLRQLVAMLDEEASGYSLDAFYARLPESLRGLVELVYDLNHRADFRLFEELLYDEDMTRSLQEIWIHTTPESERDFFMSTPRLDNRPGMTLPLHFGDSRLDALSRSRNEPVSVMALCAELGVAEEQRPYFESLFTDEEPPRAALPACEADGVRMRYFGHACVLFESADETILIDPFMSMQDAKDGRFTINDLPDRIDRVVITHCHQDHFCMEMLLQLRPRIGSIVVPGNNNGSIADPSMALVLRDMGFREIVTLRPFDRIQLAHGYLESLPFTGEHADLNIHSKHALALQLRGRKFLFLIDSDGRDLALYRRLSARLGPLDAMFIGMECHGAPLNWLYEPLLMKAVSRRNNESRRLSGANAERARNILQEVNTRRVFVYAMGQEPWMKFIMGLQYEPDSIQLLESDRFIQDCQGAGIECERLYLSRQVEF